MQKHVFLLMLTLVFCGHLSAQTVITNGDLEAGISYTWTNDQEYLLDGLVYVKPGSNLAIEAGTVIKAIDFPSTGDNTSALIVAAGATIQAIGEPSCPIIFTSEYDDLSTDTDLTVEDKGLWGGLVILGNGILGNESGLGRILGLPDIEFDQYGGTDNQDNSGILRYISVRFAGASIVPGDELNGITFAAVGSNTQVEYLEAFACMDDGFEFLGGAVNTKYLIAAFCGDDAFDIDEGYLGKGQFWFGIADQDHTRVVELDGARPDNNPVYSTPQLSNLTLIGSGPFFDATEGILFRDGGAGSFSNSIITGIPDIALSIERTDDADFDSYTKLTNGEITFTNNVWFDLAGSDVPSDFLTVANGGVTEQNFLIDYFNANANDIVDPQLTNICYDPINCMDPRPQSGSPALSGGQPLADTFFDAVDYRGAFGDENWIENWSAMDTYAPGSDCNNLEIGTIIVNQDLNGDCTTNDGEPGLGGWIINVVGPGIDYFVSTNSDGVYTGFLPGNATTATITPINYLWGVCETQVPISGLGTDPINASFTAFPAQDCPLMTVDLSTPFLRRCFDNYYTIQYCNEGTIPAEDASVEVDLDPEMDFISASLPFTVDANGFYVFDLGTVAPGECGSINIQFNLNCDAVLGQTHCTGASIFPDTSCASTLPAPSLDIEGACFGDNVIFSVTNNSEYDMLEPENYIVIDNHQLIEDAGGSLQLAAGASEAVSIPANGHTFHLQTVKRPGYPDLGVVTAGFEGCGEDGFDSFSTGFLNGFALSGGAGSQVIDCIQNIGSFDPNDKAATPTGIQSGNYLRANTDLEYKIRFQNTGTDTAFTVVVVDTISENLDLTTVRPGASSHDYEWSIIDRALIFTFNDIMLPDSNVNEPASNGFVQFSISQEPDLMDGELLFNAADIYFDFNDPIRTNEVFHTIGIPIDDVLNSTASLKEDPGLVTVFPNPLNQSTTFEVQGEPIATGLLNIYDAVGNLVRQARFSGNQLSWDRGSLSSGVYLYQVFAEDRPIGSGKILLK